MNQTNSQAVQNALISINEDYGFLFERGYEIVSADEYDLGWQVMLRKQDVFAKIIRSRGEEEIYFRMGDQPHDEFFDSGSVIYAVTGDLIPRWESSDKRRIKQYLNQIERYFEGEFFKNKDRLQAAQNKYYEVHSQREIAVAPEPKVKPILYYLLLGIILLLILGGLVTLFMVIADRLFSPF